MALGNFSNLADGTLASAINSAATSATLTTGQGAYFPSSNFWAVLWSKAYPDPAEAYRAGKAEVVLVSSRSTDVLTITRAQQGTSAVDFTGLNVGVIHATTQADYDYIRDQLALKAPLASPTFTGTITTPLTASRAVVTGVSGELTISATTAAELAYLNGVTSGIQSQIDAKAPLASPTFTGTVTTPDINVSGATVSTLAMFDGSKNLESVTLGTALSFSGSTLNAQGYCIQGMACGAGSNPADGTIYYFASDAVSAIGTYATYANNSVTIPKSGTIKKVIVKFRAATPGSNEAVAMSFRLNDSADTAIGNLDMSTSVGEVVGVISVAVAAGDTFSIKMAATTWATNPQTVRIFWLVYGE